MFMVKNSKLQYGFALPLVLIAAVVMMIVLVAAVTSVTTTRTALNNQYYNQLAKEAAESGIVMAEECINERAILRGNPLRPGSTCNGLASQCSSVNCYTVYDSDQGLRTTF